MDNRNDIEMICEVLDKEFSDIEAALLKGEKDSNRRSSATARGSERRRSSAGSNDGGLAAASGVLSNPMSDPDEV